MRYRKLDAQGDMVFGHGGEDYLQDSAETVAQSILTRLRLWRGEWYLDTTEGTPYTQEVLGMGRTATALRALQQRIADTEGVRDVLSIELVRDPDTRRATVRAEVLTDYGEVVVSG